MGYAAVNIGAHELTAGVDALKKAARRHKMPLLSASVIDGKSGKPVFEEALVVRVGGLKIGFVGVLSTTPLGLDKHVLTKGLDVRPVEVAVKAGVAAAEAKGAEMIVLLSALKRLEVDQAVAAAPTIDVVIGTDSFGMSTQLELAGDGLFVDTFTKGKFVGELRLSPGKDKTRWAAVDRRGAMQAEIAGLRSRIESGQNMLTDQRGNPLPEATQRYLETDLARLRARAAQLELALQDGAAPPESHGRVAFTAHPIDKSIRDDPKVLGWVDRYKSRYPQAAGH